MAIKNILVPLSGHGDASDLQEAPLRVALTVGRRLGARVEALHVSPDPRDAVVFVGEGMTSTMIEGIISAAEHEGTERSRRTRAFFDRLCAEFDAPRADADTPGVDTGFCAELIERIGREDEQVACRGRLADLIVASRPHSDREAGPPLTLETALRETGRPVLVTPPNASGTFGEIIAIAWNGSIEASRAVAFALPYLVQAKRVVVMSVEEGRPLGPSGRDLVAYLARHSVAADEAAVGDGGGRSIGKTLLAEAAGAGADMMVMGAYTRSRMRRLIFGGATSEVLSNTEIPVLMVH